MLYHMENPHGGDIYNGDIQLDFSENTNPYGTPEGVLRAMAEALPLVRRYPDPYCRALVAAIADHEGLPREYVLCGNGAAELIGSFCEALRPARALEAAPTFSEYAANLERIGCAVFRHYLSSEEDFALGEDFIAKVKALQPDAVFLCSPNNPTGRLIEPALLTGILRECRSLACRLFLDECFLDLAEQGVSMKAFLAEYPELILLKAFTKSYGMAGVRLGYCLSSDEDLLTKMARCAQPWNVSVPAQAAGTAALREKTFLEETRRLIREERPRLKTGLEALGFHVCPSDANYLLFRGTPELGGALHRKGIAIRSCENYAGLAPGWYRCAVKLQNENEALLRAIAEVQREV